MSKSGKPKFKRSDKLQVKAIGHAYEHNAIEWVENWRFTKLGTYSVGAAPFDPVAEAAKYCRLQNSRLFPLERLSDAIIARQSFTVPG